jgi:hypothetical protein
MAEATTLESLNGVWEEFVKANEGAYADPEGDDVPFELITDITFRIGNKEVSGTLCLCYFDNSEKYHGTDVGGHLGVQLDLNDHLGEGLFDIYPVKIEPNYPAGPWTRELIAAAFAIDPESPIWDRADV